MESLIKQPSHYMGCSELGKSLMIQAGLDNLLSSNFFDQECFIFIEQIEQINQNFFLGNCFKYLWRLGDKNNWNRYTKNKSVLMDLSKAVYYIKYYIHLQESENNLIPHWIDRLSRVLDLHLTELKFFHYESMFNIFLYDYTKV